MDAVNTNNGRRGGGAGCCLLFLGIAGYQTYSTLTNLFALINYPGVVQADVWDMELKSLSCGFGFDNTINMDLKAETDSSDIDDIKALLAQGGAYVSANPVESADDAKPLECANGKPVPNDKAISGNVGPELWATNVGLVYDADIGSTPHNLDGTPWCFSWPLVGSTVSHDKITITLNTGEKIKPYGASKTPNNEPNENHCIVFFANLGNRILPKADKSNWCNKREDATASIDSCAFFPTLFEITGDIKFVGPPEDKSKEGPWGQNDVQIKSGKGMTVKGWPDGPHPYEKGPTLIGARLTTYDTTSSSDTNSNDCIYGDRCQYRLRFYYTGGYTPNGNAGIRPTEFQKYWRLVAKNDNSDDEIQITETEKEYTVNGKTLTVVGLAELGDKMEPVDGCESKGGKPYGTVDKAGDCYDQCYDEDHDNYVDIIIEGDKDAVRGIFRLEQPADGTGGYRGWIENGTWSDAQGYQPLYNPGGGGNVRNPNAYWNIYVAGSEPVTIDVEVDLENKHFVTYDNGASSSLFTPMIVCWVLFAISFIGCIYTFTCGSLDEEPAQDTGLTGEAGVEMS